VTYLAKLDPADLLYETLCDPSSFSTPQHGRITPETWSEIILHVPRRHVLPLRLVSKYWDHVIIRAIIQHAMKSKLRISYLPSGLTVFGLTDWTSRTKYICRH
jgi:hypothetical protein